MAYAYAWTTAGPVGTDLVSDGAQEIREGVKAALNERILSVIGNIDNDPWQFKNIQAYANNTYDIGTTSSRFKAGYINGLAINIAVAPTAGNILLGNTGVVQSRNALGTLNLDMLSMNSSNVLQLYAGAATLTSAGVLTTTTVVGALTGNASTATALATARLIWGQSFDGTAAISGAMTYGGVTLNAAVTGTGNMVLSAGPTFTGTVTAAALTASGTIKFTNGGATVASSGQIQLPNTSVIAWRNAGSTADIYLSATSGDVFRMETSAAVLVPLQVGTINGQTISSAASFTGTVTVATSVRVTGAGSTSGITLGSNGAAPTYGALSFNNVVSGSAGIIGFTGGGGTDKNLYYLTPTGGIHSFRVNDVEVVSIGATTAVQALTATTGTFSDVCAITKHVTAVRATPILSLKGTTSGDAQSMVFSDGVNSNGWFGYKDSATAASRYFYISANDGVSDQFTFAQTGAFTASGNCTALAFFTSSSRDLKRDIKRFTDSALAILCDTDIYGYAYKTDPSMGRIGWMANKTHILLAGPKHDRMDLPNAVGLLVKGVQELDAKIEDLRARLS